ncbi:MAG: hypothetical protein IJE40_03150 [Clostridia bacterium]|nr:hypothetical protein [Clostridia bacterium]
MKMYKYNEKPLEVHGIPHFEKHGKLERLPEDVRIKVPSLSFLGIRTPGARLCFRTNSTKITVRIEFETMNFDHGMSMKAAQSANVLIGERKKARFAGLVSPKNYNEKIAENTFEKSGDFEDVTIWFPRNEVISDISVSIEDDAEIESPSPYKYPPMLFYGSSITEGGCACRVTNAYNAIISQHLDADYYNFGFSGCAKGELALADYINTIPMSIFVMDYDHNAPTVEHLAATHEPFFKRIRENNPDLPIVLMTRPNFDNDITAFERREIIKNTYKNAVDSGDKNIYFIDGETFFGNTDREFCTNDGCHPNDLGFYRMASVVEPVIKKILEEKYN